MAIFVLYAPSHKSPKKVHLSVLLFILRIPEKKYKKSINIALAKGIKDSWASAGTFALTSYIDQAISVLLLWYGGSVVMDDPQLLSVGQLITFQLYWNLINTSYQNLAGVASSFTRAGGAAQRVMTLLDNLPDIDPYKGEPIPHINGDLAIENVEFFYQMRPDAKILKGIGLKIAAGEVCALVGTKKSMSFLTYIFKGRSGGGKSTIIGLLLRYYDPKSGRITLDGQDYTKLNPISLRKHIGIVAQETQLFNMSVEENIAYGVDSYTQEELMEAAKLANAHDFIMRFEDDYQTRVGEKGLRLSGGQKQR